MNKDKIKKIFNKLKKEKFFYNYSVLIVSLFVSAINYNLFLRPLKIVAGGTNGLSIIFENIFSIDPSIFIFVFSFVVLIIGYFTLGIKKTSSALAATFIYPLFVNVTENLDYFIIIGSEHIIISAIFSGIITGWVSGLICKVNLSQGGIILIDQILYEKFRISISKSNFIINFIIVIAGGYYFGITNLLCAVILLFINSIVIDKVMLGVSDNKFFYIMTNKEEEVKNYILNDLKNGVTIFNVKSGRDDDEKSIFMVSVANELYYKVTKKIKTIDNKAFFIVTDSYEVIGGHNN